MLLTSYNSVCSLHFRIYTMGKYLGLYNKGSEYVVYEIDSPDSAHRLENGKLHKIPSVVFDLGLNRIVVVCDYLVSSSHQLLNMFLVAVETGSVNGGQERLRFWRSVLEKYDIQRTISSQEANVIIKQERQTAITFLLCLKRQSNNIEDEGLWHCLKNSVNPEGSPFNYYLEIYNFYYCDFYGDGCVAPASHTVAKNGGEQYYIMAAIYVRYDRSGNPIYELPFDELRAINKRLFFEASGFYLSYYSRSYRKTDGSYDNSPCPRIIQRYINDFKK